MIPLPVFMNLAYELILKFKWCSTSLGTAIHICVVGHTSHNIGQISSKMGIGLVENGAVLLP